MQLKHRQSKDFTHYCGDPDCQSETAARGVNRTFSGMRINFIVLQSILLSIHFSCVLKAQTKVEFHKIWISPTLQYLDLRRSDSVFFDYGMGDLEGYKLEKEDSVFHLVQYENIYGIEKPRKLTQSYKIIRLTEDTLIVHPLTKYTKSFLEDILISKRDKNYIFVNKLKQYDSQFIFHRLYFSSTPCFGTCASMKYEIDSIGNIEFLGEKNSGKYIGKYVGRLSTSQMDKLIEILKSSMVDKIPQKLRGGIDGPKYLLILSYNKKIKTIGGSNPPYFNRSLFNYLLLIYNHLEMRKAKNIHFLLPDL